MTLPEVLLEEVVFRGDNLAVRLYPAVLGWICGKRLCAEPLVMLKHLCPGHPVFLHW